MNTAPSCPLTKVDRLLLATDRSTYSAGAEREAIRLAARCASRLFIMSVIESNPEYETIGASVYEKEEQEAMRYLQSLKAAAEREGVSYCETALHFGEETCQTIIDEAAERSADMIIIGRRGRSGLMSRLMGGVAGRVISHAPCKVLIVPRAARMECRNILVATDGSAHSTAAAEEAVGIAKRCGSRVIAVSAIGAGLEPQQANANAGAVVELAHKESIEAEALTQAGPAQDLIVETAAGRGVDLIVMGTYGKTSLKKYLMGSSTEKVIGRAGCAVLVVSALRAARVECTPGMLRDEKAA